MIIITFGSELRRFRLGKRMTLREAAVATGFDLGALSKIECDKLAPPKKAKKIKHLARKLFLDPTATRRLLNLALKYHIETLQEEFGIEESTHT